MKVVCYFFVNVYMKIVELIDNVYVIGQLYTTMCKFRRICMNIFLISHYIINYFPRFFIVIFIFVM